MWVFSRVFVENLPQYFLSLPCLLLFPTRDNLENSCVVTTHRLPPPKPSLLLIRPPSLIRSGALPALFSSRLSPTRSPFLQNLPPLQHVPLSRRPSKLSLLPLSPNAHIIFPELSPPFQERFSRPGFALLTVFFIQQGIAHRELHVRPSRPVSPQSPLVTVTPVPLHSVRTHLSSLLGGFPVTPSGHTFPPHMTRF